jgi:hypothetical protein
MPRRLFILCEKHEKELKEVYNLCLIAQKQNVVIDFPVDPGWDFYKILEESIEQCDVLVAVVSEELKGATWSNHCLNYANSLKNTRFSPRPRIIGLRINNMNLPRCSEHIQMEWICKPEDYDLILKDLPQKTEGSDNHPVHRTAKCRRP